LAREAEHNAAELNAAAESLERMSNSVTEAASVADAADKIVTVARKKAEGSEEVIQATSDAMEKIKDSSNEISNVTAVIEDIALQTNLLALNAGVEAARAGEAGRGFAIVAQEVRNLAVRCRDAVESINALVAEAKTQAHDGANEFMKTRDTIEVIIDSFNSIQQNVTEISQTTKQQANGLGELTGTVSGLLSMAQGNAASLEENAASSQTLVDEARNLLKQLEVLSGQPQAQEEGWKAA
jgi:methyl-accepting chemotaxis protein